MIRKRLPHCLNLPERSRENKTEMGGEGGGGDRSFLSAAYFAATVSDSCNKKKKDVIKYNSAFEQCCALVSDSYIKSEKTYGGLVRRPEIILRRNPACLPRSSSNPKLFCSRNGVIDYSRSASSHVTYRCNSISKRFSQKNPTKLILYYPVTYRCKAA